MHLARPLLAPPLFAALFAAPLAVEFAAPALAQTAPAAAPSVADAQAFMDRAEAALLEAGNETQRTAWVQETYITVDSEAISAKAAERFALLQKRMTGEDHLDAGPMLEYFQPLYLWLKQQNELNKSKPGWTAE